MTKKRPFGGRSGTEINGHWLKRHPKIDPLLNLLFICIYLSQLWANQIWVDEWESCGVVFWWGCESYGPIFR
jgi:hypothetical protein